MSRRGLVSSGKARDVLVNQGVRLVVLLQSLNIESAVFGARIWHVWVVAELHDEVRVLNGHLKRH